MLQSIAFLISGVVFGLSAGISPGPLLTLAISETLKFGKKEGVKIAIAPLITDIPIILLTVFILASLSKIDIFLGFISLVGGLFLFRVAYENFTVKKLNLKSKKNEISSIKKGIISNFLNPHPYLFWFFIGGPTLLKSYDLTIIATAFFILGFYASLVGSKIVIVLAAEKSRDLLKGKIYSYIIRVLGLLLLIFAIFFIKDSLTYFNINIFR